MPCATPEAQARLEETRRTQILEAAAQVFSQKGFDRATVTEIARAARLSEGSIYNYFRSKEDLLIHIPQQLIRPVFMPLLEQAHVPEDLPGVERVLLAVATAAVDRVRTYASFLKVFLSALPYLSAQAKEAYMQLLPIAAAEVLQRFLEDGMQRGLFRRDLNPVIAARILPGTLMVFLMLQEVLLGRRLTPYDYDEIVPEAVRVFLHGTAHHDSRGRRANRPSTRRIR